MPRANSRKSPRLRTVQRIPPPFPLNVFPAEFALNIGREIVYILAADPLSELPDRQPDIEGRVWERIFATAIGGQWKPSNVGLDDVLFGNCAWGAKTVKGGRNPFAKTEVRLISGRNSPTYSFNRKNLKIDAKSIQNIGNDVLSIWNERVGNLRARYVHMRTVVLIKSLDLAAFTVFETETIMYPPDQYRWELNKNSNLQGYDRQTDEHKFTWQPSGSQFTVLEKVPIKRLNFSVRRPRPLSSHAVLSQIGFNSSWIKIH